MRSSHALRGLASATVTVVSSVAGAAAGGSNADRLTAVWQHVPITPPAIRADPQLADMQCWDLLVSTTGDWASAGLRAVLPPGNAFYNHPFGGHTRPNPALVAVFPALAYDTYVNPVGDTGTSGAPALLGGFPEGQPLNMRRRVISVSWGDLVPDAPGTYPIVRLTFPLDATPNVINLDDEVRADTFSQTWQVNPTAVVEIPDIPDLPGRGVTIPEPAATAFVVAAGLVTALRRRRPTGTAARVAPLALALALASPAVASAQITAFWQRATITPQAVVEDPVLAGMQSWDLMVTASGDWSTGHLRAQLPAGQFYNHRFGSNARPSAAIISMFPGLAFDTFITAPSDCACGAAAPAIFGGFPDGEPFSMSGSVVSVGWGDLVPDAPGTYQVARLTFTARMFPDVLNDDPAPVPAFSHVTQAFPDAAAEIPDIPEPAGALALAAGGLLLVRRERASTTEFTCAD